VSPTTKTTGEGVRASPPHVELQTGVLVAGDDEMPDVILRIPQRI